MHHSTNRARIGPFVALLALPCATACVQDQVPREPDAPARMPTATIPSPATAAPQRPVAPATPSPAVPAMNMAPPAASAPPPVGTGTGGAPAVPQLPTPPEMMGSTAAPIDPQCDLRGGWVEQHILRNSTLGAAHLVTCWNYHRIEQEGDRVRIAQSLDCGLAVRGTTDVALADATLEAIATRTTNSVGVQGRFARSADGSSCTLELDRTYSIWGADIARYLTAQWKVGDPPKPLSEFTMPTSARDGMEDWDGDGREGITALTGLGDRYIAELHFFGFKGQVPLGATMFGGQGVISVDHDAREAISSETPALLQAASTMMPPGYAWFARVESGEFELPTAKDQLLAACKKVQALAIAKFGDPPRP